jgi:hypothetical protein
MGGIDRESVPDQTAGGAGDADAARVELLARIRRLERASRADWGRKRLAGEPNAMDPPRRPCAVFQRPASDALSGHRGQLKHSRFLAACEIQSESPGCARAEGCSGNDFRSRGIDMYHSSGSRV